MNLKPFKETVSILVKRADIGNPNQKPEVLLDNVKKLSDKYQKLAKLVAHENEKQLGIITQIKNRLDMYHLMYTENSHRENYKQNIIRLLDELEKNPLPEKFV